MKKMKHIAVVLRGHVRTWNFNAPKVFEFYDSIADNVDYYFTTWDSSNTDGIEGTFKDQNLIHFQILSHTFENSILTQGDWKGKWYNGQLGPPYMNIMVLPHLRRREKQLGNKYECVFDTRPDVLPVTQKILFGDDAGKEISIIKPEPNSIYITGLEIQVNLSSDNPASAEDIAIQDWFLYMGSDEFEKFSMRYHSDNFIYTMNTGPGCQIELREYIAQNQMYLCIQDWSKGYMIRPNVFRLDWLDSQDLHQILNTNKEWPAMSTDKKIENCDRYNISLPDYIDTASITCKI
jgi:hypothetical protein|tara:strand:+ start:518 stop:1393 length:876 start_codon:yes stop_codon:yes gene_type:complete